MNVEKTSHSAPNLWALPGESAREARVAVCNEHTLKNKIHRLIAFAAKKRLIDADEGAKEKRAQRIGGAPLGEVFRSHRCMPRVEELVVWSVCRPSFVAFGKCGSRGKNQQYENASHRPNETKISHGWRLRAWLAVEVFS